MDVWKILIVVKFWWGIDFWKFFGHVGFDYGIFWHVSLVMGNFFRHVIFVMRIFCHVSFLLAWEMMS